MRPVNHAFYQAQMQHAGVRRLWVLSGERAWSMAQVLDVRQHLDGDWLWLGETAPEGFQHRLPSRARTLLGQEFRHAVFDATQGLDVEALAILAGTLAAGSWLILLAPDWATWPACIDSDSIRWSDTPQPIATPHFITHMQSILSRDQEVMIWQQALPDRCQYTPLTPRVNWIPPTGAPTAEQSVILPRLQQTEKGIWVLTAGRGRGKSTLAGMLAKSWQGQVWLTAPSQASVETLQQYAQGHLKFYAPDHLCAICESAPPENVDWLIIDEAAAIPLPVLQRLIPAFPRVLLTTTLQGYEGTGRGFLLKFCATLPAWQSLELQSPIRWAAGDPLERVVDSLLLFQEPASISTSTSASTGSWVITSLNQAQLVQQPERMQAFYLLLTSAHYRTRPLDLRRLMDGAGMHFALAERHAEVIGAVWRVAEGGLSAHLAREVWAGRRRPRGNLVAQSLAAHTAYWQAATLRSSRISRIAVRPDFRRKGVARALLEQEKDQARQQGEDFVSVSFGFTAELWQFWQSNGFQLVRIGSQKEASSGCYAAMALFPLSDAGRDLCQQAIQGFARHALSLPPEVASVLALPSPTDSDDLTLAEWQELAGFAFAHRPLEASQFALLRLLKQSGDALPGLRAVLQQRLDGETCARQLHLTGRKALLARLRQETSQALYRLNSDYFEQWRVWVANKS